MDCQPIAIRYYHGDYKATLRYMFHRKSDKLNVLSTLNAYQSDHKDNSSSNYSDHIIDIHEDTYQVDGIGGTSWDGSLILSKFMEDLLVQNHNTLTDTCHSSAAYHIIELGCGSGVASIISSMLGAKVTATDRYCDLVKENIGKTCYRLQEQSYLQLTTSIDDRDAAGDNAKDKQVMLDLKAIELSWEASSRMINHRNHSSSHNPNINRPITTDPKDLVSERGDVDIIIGAEITCLIKQQRLLVDTIDALTKASSGLHIRHPIDTVTATTIANNNHSHSYPKIVFLTFDGLPDKNISTTNYEMNMIAMMKEKKYLYTVVYVGHMDWVSSDEYDITTSRSKSTTTSPTSATMALRNNKPLLKKATADSKYPPPNSFSADTSKDTFYSKGIEVDYDQEKKFGNDSIMPPPPPSIDDNDSISSKHYRHHQMQNPLSKNFSKSCIDMNADSKRTTGYFYNYTDYYKNKVNDFNFIDLFSSPISMNTESKNKEENLKLLDENSHHVIAFYHISAMSTCRRCHQQYINIKGFNHSTSCVYHKGLYVCRKHPLELNCSINGLGDGLGYYGNGIAYDNGWNASFWDCCGSEEKNQRGCCTSHHAGYT